MKRYHVRRVPGSGLINWAEAELLNDFTFAWQTREAPLTEFRALWDDEHLHFQFHCVDEDLVLPDGADAKERVIASDRVEIFFAPNLELKPYYCLEMSPRGDVLDYEATHYRQMNWDWHCAGLEITTRIEGTRYEVSGRVPMETLRALGVIQNGSGRLEILAGIYRAEFYREADGNVHHGWMPWVNPQTPQPDFHVPESFGIWELGE